MKFLLNFGNFKFGIWAAHNLNCEPSLAGGVASCAARYASSEEHQIYVFDEGDDNKVTAARLADDSFRSAKPHPAESQHCRVLVGLV